MKQFFSLTSLILLCAGGAVSAHAQDDQYVKVFNTILQADGLKDAGNGRGALEKYLAAESELKKIQAAHPTWNDKIIQFRLKYVADRIAPLKAQFPGPLTPLAPVPRADDLRSEQLTGMQKQMALLNEETIRLRAEKALAEAQLKEAQAQRKEALAARPADVDPVRMKALEEKIKTLQRESDLQRISLDQQTSTLAALTKEKQSLQSKMDGDKSLAPKLKTENEELRKQLADATKAGGSVVKVEEINTKLALAKTEMKNLVSQNETLTKENKKMEALLTDPNFQAGGSTSTLEKELQAAKQANADLEKKLAEALKAGEKKNQ